VRAYSSEKHAPLQSAKRKQLTSGSNFFLTNQVRDLIKITADNGMLFVWAKQNYTFGIDSDQTQTL